jgi:exopolysaccharide biosynthesis polyprenyl glycosylphosphotransferase
VASDVPVGRQPLGGGAVLPSPAHRADVTFAVPVPPQLDDATSMAAVVVGPDRQRNGIRIEAAHEGSARSVPVAGAVEGRGLGAGLFTVDLAAVLVSFAVVGFALAPGATVARRLAPGVLGAVGTLGAMHVLGLYRSRCCARGSSYVWRLTLASLFGGLVLVVAQLPTGSARWPAAACTGAAVAATGIGRWQYGRFLRARRADGRYLRPVLLIGSNADAAYLRTFLRSEPELGYEVAGVVSGEEIEPSLADLPTARSVDGIPRLASATRATGVFIVPYALSSKAVEDAIAIAAEAGLHVQLWPGLRTIGDARLRSMPLSGEPLFYVEPRTSASWQLSTKRAIDIVGAVVGLVCCAPVLAIAAALVKLDDRGPVFYRGERIGLHGRPISPVKLRTMRREETVSSTTLKLINQRTDGPLFKSSVDPRVTRVGHFLRASSIDELPQLWNVLKGTMSLIGPRPALPAEVAEFDRELQRRHSVKPGLTGLWQVQARHNPSFNAYRRLDLRYVDNWSLRLDIAILVATLPAVVSQACRAMRDNKQRI